ncbi:MAG: SDR family NAD(P)-dependent oxidoreductase, partial [Bacteroidia bacterium]
MELNSKVVVITGVSRGIGNALVHQFLSKGCIVFGLGFTDPIIDNNQFAFYKTDIRNRSEVKASFNSILEQSEDQIDILVNNAGVG